MSLDQSILDGIHDNLSCGVLDMLMPKLTLLGCWRQPSCSVRRSTAVRA